MVSVHTNPPQLLSRIAIITNTYPPEFGAAPARIANMAQALQKSGHEVVVFTGMPNYPQAQVDPAYRKQWAQKEKQAKVQIRRYWTWAYRGSSKLGRLSQMLSQAISMLSSIPFLLRFKPQWIFVQYPPIALPLFAILASKLLNSKLIVNYSDLWPQAMVDLKVIEENGLFHRLLKGIERTTFQNAHAYMAQSMEVYEHLPNYRPKLLYRTAVQVEKFKPAQTRTLQGEKLKLVYAGVMGMAHGLFELCQAINWEKLPVELHIYGDGLDRPLIESWLKEHEGIAVFLHSPVPADQIPEILPQHDAVLIPQKVRIKGTVPSKIYEAMAAGLPIVFVGGGEGAKLISQYECGYNIEAGNFDKLARVLQELQQSSPQERAKLGQAGRNAAETHFNRANITASLVQWIKQLESSKAAQSDKVAR